MPPHAHARRQSYYLFARAGRQRAPPASLCAALIGLTEPPRRRRHYRRRAYSLLYIRCLSLDAADAGRAAIRPEADMLRTGSSPHFMRAAPRASQARTFHDDDARSLLVGRYRRARAAANDEPP